MIMDRCGWPEIPLDGKLLISHQDALLMGGKVQAAAGYANHVVFRDPELVPRVRSTKLCVEMCSGQAITRGDGRRARIRSREVRVLRRLPVELPAERGRRARKH